MGMVIKELVQQGHDQAAELKSSCGAVDVRSVAQLISDLASQLDMQLARSNALATENAALKKSEAEFNEYCREECERDGDTWVNDFTETPATDAVLAEVRVQGVGMFSERFGGGTLLSDTVKETAKEFAARLRKGVQS